KKLGNAALNAPSEPTYFHGTTRNTTIDIAISKGMTVIDSTSIPELSSDHNPVLFEKGLSSFSIDENLQERSDSEAAKFLKASREPLQKRINGDNSDNLRRSLRLRGLDFIPPKEKRKCRKSLSPL
ncbi:hypothetical protein TNCT_646101, partial [Trichonephila clavata]